MDRWHTGRRVAVLLAVVLSLSLAAPATVLATTAPASATAAFPGTTPASDGVAAPPPAAGTVAVADDAPSAAPPAVGTLQGFEADRTSFRITVYENGSAEWLFRHEKSLNDSERQDFEAFAAEFNGNETELFVNFRRRARWLTDNGTAATGREMTATNFRRDARTEGLDPQTRSLGVVEMSFRWTGFAVVTSEGRVEAGDVFRGGLYIGPDQELLYATGPNLTFVSAEPDDADRIVSGDSLADSESVTWRGEKSFGDRRPRAVFTTRGPTTGATATPTAGSGNAGDTPGLLLPVGALLVVLVLGAAAAVAYRSGVLPPSSDGGASAGSADDAGGGSGAGAEASAVGVPEEELLSDEERVIDLIEDNGGRMKQVDIVEATDWSKSKVSMLLSDMEEAERISKLRVGRENIVSLTGHEPDAAGSPFDDTEE